LEPMNPAPPVMSKLRKVFPHLLWIIVWISCGQSWITADPRGESYHELWKLERRSTHGCLMIDRRNEP